MYGMNDNLLAEYMVGRCRQGFDYIAMYLAATLFERLIHTKLNRKNPYIYNQITNSKDNNSLRKIIDAVGEQMGCGESHVALKDRFQLEEVFKAHAFFTLDDRKLGIRKITSSRDAYNKLRFFNKVRNSIIHTENPEEFLTKNEKDVIDLILYIASENCPKLFQTTLRNIQPRDMLGLRQVLDGKHADYLVRSVDEVMIKRFDKAEGLSRTKWKIEEKDFSNLFHLRKKLVPLKNTLDKWLGEKYPALSTTILTTIDTASAYIWMPIVHIDKCREDARPNLQSATASILVTPLDLRIYIDFGGQCYPDRKEYFKFIREPDGKFMRFLSKLNDADRENFLIFDVEWYSFIRNKRTVESILNNFEEWVSTVNVADKELDVLRVDPIITTNRLLSGFVFDRDWIEANGPLKEDFILQKLSQIIDLYCTLLKIDKV